MNDITGVPQDDCLLVGVCFEAGSGIDQVLGCAADELARRGSRVAGLVQVRGETTGGCDCREMRLRDLATGKMHLISEKRGPEARGCHLDRQALAGAAQSLEQSLSEDTDVLFINRFGQSESEGRGLRPVIERAMMLGISVIVAYRAEYEKDWAAFHGGMAVGCPPHAKDILSLCRGGDIRADTKSL